MSDEEDELGEEEQSDNLGTYEGDRNENDERHGFGKAILPNGDTYEGQYENGKRHGTGTYRFSNGARYVGEIEVPWSFLETVCPFESGEYQKHKRHGRGTFHYPDGSKYDGEWNENIREGHGTYTYPNNDTYEGEWKNNQRYGKGTYTYATTKAQYIGTWIEGKRQGPGEMQFAQYRYIGKFHENYPKGKGRFVFKNGYQQNGEYYITTINDEEDSGAPTQIQYRWIAKNVTAIQQDVPYADVNDEPVDTNRIEELVHKFKDEGLSITEEPDEAQPMHVVPDAKHVESVETEQVNDEVPGAEQFDEDDRN
ncbi:unnamed protein product [Adineta ricciae]|uniref:Uncharacterized protein n=1 Tax=Adineta ricciae TaxID=249248 RepID=A0A813QWZ6_ADIRI|nr:unnamed protein product [Adineta ricciae]